jgi:hypothetical protein
MAQGTKWPVVKTSVVAGWESTERSHRFQKLCRLSETEVDCILARLTHSAVACM